MSIQAIVDRFLKTVLILALCIPLTAAAQTNVEYQQHWRSGDSRPWYGQGTVTATTPSDQQTPANMKITVRLDSHPQAPNNSEWVHARDSFWDIAVSKSGVWTTIASPIHPSAFADNRPNVSIGFLEVTVNMPLEDTAESEIRRSFEVYGTCDNLNVSPPNVRRQTMFAIPGEVVWKSDSTGKVEYCNVTFAPVAQARGLGGLSPSYPLRKSERLGQIFSSQLQYTTGFEPPTFATHEPSCGVSCLYESYCYGGVSATNGCQWTCTRATTNRRCLFWRHRCR
jgi:hypothetical protein